VKFDHKTGEKKPMPPRAEGAAPGFLARQKEAKKLKASRRMEATKR
jgi:hypothetical protein